MDKNKQGGVGCRIYYRPMLVYSFDRPWTSQQTNSCMACLLSDVEQYIKFKEDEIRKLSSAMGFPANDSFKEEFLEVLKDEEEIWRKEKTEKKRENREKQKKMEASFQIRPNLKRKTIKVVHPSTNPQKKEIISKPCKGSPKVTPLHSDLQNKKNFYLSLPKKTPRPNSVNYIYLEIVNAQHREKKSSTTCDKVKETKKGIFVPLLKENNKEPAKKCKRAADTPNSIVPSKSLKVNCSSSVHQHQNQAEISEVQNKNKDTSGFVKESGKENIGTAKVSRNVKEPKRRRKIQHPQKCLPFEDEYIDSSDGFFSMSMRKDNTCDVAKNDITQSSKYKACSLKIPIPTEKEPQLPVLVDDMLLTPPIAPTGKSEESELHLFPSDFFANLETLPSCPKEMDYECETSVFNLLQDIMCEK